MELNKKNIPTHVAIIMDGNGRWASERGKMRIEGHREGMFRVKEIIRAAQKSGVKFLTLFTFSSENWKRSKTEVSLLMRALDSYIKSNLKELQDNNICLKVIGRKHPIPEYVQKSLNRAQDLTKSNTGITVILALNYGSRQEILDAVRAALRDILAGRLEAGRLDEEKFKSFLYTARIPDPDLLIRTSGEERISNFLLWQLSYAELYFTKVFWPDFKEKEFLGSLAEYQRRARRFGGV